MDYKRDKNQAVNGLILFSGWFQIDILECIDLCDRRVKEFKVSKYFVNIFHSVIDW